MELSIVQYFVTGNFKRGRLKDILRGALFALLTFYFDLRVEAY